MRKCLLWMNIKWTASTFQYFYELISVHTKKTWTFPQFSAICIIISTTLGREFSHVWITLTLLQKIKIDVNERRLEDIFVVCNLHREQCGPVISTSLNKTPNACFKFYIETWIHVKKPQLNNKEINKHVKNKMGCFSDPAWRAREDTNYLYPARWGWIN